MSSNTALHSCSTVTYNGRWKVPCLYFIVPKICQAILLYIILLQQHKRERMWYFALYFVLAKIYKAILLYIVPLQQHIREERRYLVYTFLLRNYVKQYCFTIKLLFFIEFRKYWGQSGTGRNIFGVLYYLPVFIIPSVFHIHLSVVWEWMDSFKNYLKIRDGGYHPHIVVLFLTAVLVITVGTRVWLGR